MRHTQSDNVETRELHASRNGRPTLAVRDIMSTAVVVLDPEATLRDAVELLAGRHISGAPVVSGGKVVGVLSASDLLTFEAVTPAVPTDRQEQAEDDALELPEEGEWAKDGEAPGTYFNELWSDAGADVAERFAELGGPEWDLLAEHTVAEVMSRGVRSVAPGLSVADAAAYMLNQRIHRAVVVERNGLVGIVTATDIMRAVAQHRI